MPMLISKLLASLGVFEASKPKLPPLPVWKAARRDRRDAGRHPHPGKAVRS